MYTVYTNHHVYRYTYIYVYMYIAMIRYLCIGSSALSDPLISLLFIIHISPEKVDPKGIVARVCHRMPGC